MTGLRIVGAALAVASAVILAGAVVTLIVRWLR